MVSTTRGSRGELLRSNYDTRKYPLCAPFDGTRGEEFLAFERDFTAAIADEADDYSSLLECLQGTCPAPENATQRRASIKRSKTLFGKIFRHISNDGLRKRLSAMEGNDNMSGRAAWLLLERECRPVISDLDVERLNALWVNASIQNSVGHTPGTCLDFKRYLNGLNADRPDGEKKSLTELSTKFLNSFKQPEALAVEAMKELKATGASRAFVFTNPDDDDDPRNGQRDFDSIVSHFDKLWTHMFSRGLIRPQVARTSTLPSTRVDGEQFMVEEDQGQGKGKGNLMDEMRCFNCHGFGHGSRVCPSEKKRRDVSHVIEALKRVEASSSTPGGDRPSQRGPKAKSKTKKKKKVSVYLLEDGTLMDQRGNSFLPQHETSGGEATNHDGDAADSLIEDTQEPADEIQYVESRYGHLLPEDISLISDSEDDCFSDGSIDDDEKGGAYLGRSTWHWSTSPPYQAIKRKDKHPYPKRRRRKGRNKERGCASSSSSGPQGENPADLWDLSLGMQNSWARDIDAWLCGYKPKDVGGSHIDSSTSFEPPHKVPMELGTFNCDPTERGGLPCERPQTKGPPRDNESKSLDWHRACIDESNSLMVHKAFLVLRINPRSLMRPTQAATLDEVGSEFGGQNDPIQIEIGFEPCDTILTIQKEKVRPPNVWVIDCGATKHCVPSESCCDKILCRPRDRHVRVANGQRIQVVAIGSVKVHVQSTLGPTTMTLKTVLVIPAIRARIFSCEVGWQVDHIKTHLNDERCLELSTGARIPFLEFGVSERKSRHYLIAEWVPPPLAKAKLAPSSSSLSPSPPTKEEIANWKGGDCVRFVFQGEQMHDLLHARLAHFGVSRIREALKQCDGLPSSHYQHDPIRCPSCQIAGAHRNPIVRDRGTSKGKPPRSKATYKRFGEHVCSDLCGPFPKSANGFRYAIVFIDSLSKWVAVYFLHDKSPEGVLSAHKQFLSDHEVELRPNNRRVTVWHTDNGGEFVSRDLDAFCIEMATRRSFSIPHVPEHNATAERVWGAILRPTRILIHASGLPMAFWPFAMSHSVYVHNRLPTRGHDPIIAPFEVLYEKRPDLSKVRVFGCLSYVTLPKRKGDTKLTPKGFEAVHLGLDPYRKGYFVYIPELRRVASAYHIRFDESNFIPMASLEDVPMYEPLASGGSTTPTPKRDRKRGAAVGNAVPAATVPVVPAPPNTTTIHPDVYDGGSETESPPSEDEEVHVMSEHNGKAFSSASMSPTFIFAIEDNMSEIAIPSSIEEALSPNNKYRKQWLEACIDEIKGKQGENRSWWLIHRSKLPKGAKVLKGKWVFSVKTKSDGSIERFKARFVGCGYSQRKGIDYEQTFASTLKGSTFRLLLACVCARGLKMQHVDIKRAFTQQSLPENCELYVEQPKGFEQPGFVCKLTKALEGLKQSAHLLMEKLSSHFKEGGFDRSPHDPCLYTRKTDEGVIILGVYVDDVLVAYSCESLFHEFWSRLSSTFKCNSPQEVTKFMGLEISHNQENGTIKIGQSTYIEQMFHKYLNGVHTKLYSTPVGTSQAELDRFMELQVAQTQSEADRVIGKDYLGLVGSLLWAACMTRPDIAYHTAFLCQFMHCPSMDALVAAQGVLAYLQRTKDHVLTYHKKHPALTADQDRMGFRCPHFETNHGLHMYFDSSWNKVPMPFYGWVVMFMGCAVSWSAKKLKIVPLSSAEAETACGSIACRDLQFVKFVLGDLFMEKGGIPMSPIPVVTDSEATYHGSENPGATGRTRHYERWLFYLRELAMNMAIKVIHTKTSNMMADVFTKAVDKGTFIRCRSFLLG